MKIKFGSIVTDGRNKLGGHVASRNHYGAYLRTNVEPLLVQNEYTQSRRDAFLYLSQNYKNLTDTQKIAWKNATKSVEWTDKFGDVYNPTAKNLYVSVNLNRYTVGNTYTDEVPELTIPTLDMSFSLSSAIDDEEFILSFAYPDDDEASNVVLWATNYLSKGRMSVTTELRKIAVIGTTTPETYNAFNDYISKYAAMYEDSRVFVKVQRIGIDSGMAGVEFIAYADIKL